jgi:hypothetical protein
MRRPVESRWSSGRHPEVPWQTVCQCVVIKPASDDLEGFIHWYVGEGTNDIEIDEDILSTNINRLQQFYEVTGILNEGIGPAGQRSQYY